MEKKKSNLKRTLEQIRELFQDVEKLESIVESIATEKEFENISLTANVIIKSLVGKLKDVDNSLRSSYSGRMKRKREKCLKRAQRNYDKEQKSEEGSCSNDGPADKISKRNNIDKEPYENLEIGENGETVLSKGSIENDNPSTKQESSEKLLTNSLDGNSDNENTKNSIETLTINKPSNHIEDGSCSNDNLDENSRLEKSDISDNDKLSSKECTESNKLAITRDFTSDDNASNELFAETSGDDSKTKTSKEQGNQIERYRSEQSNDDKSDDSEASDASTKKSTRKGNKSQIKKTLRQPARDVSESDRKKSGKKKTSDKKKFFAKKNVNELSKNKKQCEKSSDDLSDSSEVENDKRLLKKNITIRDKGKSKNYEDVVEENSSDDTLKKISAKGNRKRIRRHEEQSKSDSDNTEMNNEKEIAQSTISKSECVEEEAVASSKENEKDVDVESAVCKSVEKDNSEATQGGNKNTLEDSVIAISKETAKEVQEEKSNEQLVVKTTEKDAPNSEDNLDEVVAINDKCSENIEKPNNASVESETTILLDDSEHKSGGASTTLTETVRKEAKEVGNFPISLEQLDQVIDSYLSTSQDNESKHFEDKEAPTNKHEPEITLPDSVMLTELNPNLVVIDDDSEDDKKNEEDNLESHSLVGKINVVDLKKLTMSDNIDISDESAKGLPNRPKIRVASFARISKFFNEDVSSKEQDGETNTNGEEDKEDKKIIDGKRSRNPHAQKLNEELFKLKEVRNHRLEKERLIKEKHELEHQLKLKRKKRKEKERFLKKRTCTKQKEDKSKRATHEAFAIGNNRPVLLVPIVPKEPSDQVMYSIAKPDELDDNKLLDRCVVRMMARQTPEALQLNYNIKQRQLEDEKEQLGVTMSFDDDDVASDGDSDSSSTGAAMVSGAVGKRQPVRSCNSSTSSSRHSSVNNQRTTRNVNPIAEREARNDSSSDDDEVAVESRKKGPDRRSRPRKDESKVKKNGQRKRRGSSDDDESGERDDERAMSHVSISSSSGTDTKKSSSQKHAVTIPKIKKEAKSSLKDSDSTDEGDADSDSLPLTKLPDIKSKKVSASDDSDGEPAKKKDRKNNKEKCETESDSEDSVSAKKKAVNLRSTKKKRVVSDSDENISSDDDIESIKSSASEEKEKEKHVAKKQGRKRIKRVNDDSSDDSSNEKPKRGKKKSEAIDTRKHIRSIIGKRGLNQSTIDAEQEEQDRKNRISEKQKKYNDIYNPDDLESAKLNKVILDFDEETNEEILSVDRSLVKRLKPHQAKGIQFMWNACYESVNMIDDKGSGCILAHCMGLGKTLQVIALIHTLILNSDSTKTEKALVVCPLSTVLNWVSEFKKWLTDDIEFEIYEMVNVKQVAGREDKIADWHRHGGVMIMGYDMFRNLSNPDNKRISKKTRNTFLKALVDPGPDLVICDEGHLLKNEKTSISIAMNRIRTLRRIVLTGTPLQNNLKEYFCMVQFVKPNLLGTYKEYLNRFVNPITNGQYTDSTLHDIQIMRKRSHVLHKLLDGIVQRRDYAVLAPYLPPKHEYVIFVTLTPQQIALYDHYLNVIAPSLRTQATKGVSLFKDFQEFQRICTHPRVLLDKSVQDQMAKWKEEEDNEDSDGSEGSLKNFIDDDEEEARSTSSESSKSSFGSHNSGDAPRRGRSKPKTVATRTTRAVAAEKGIDVAAATTSLEVANTGSEWWRDFASNETLDDLMCSSKLSLLFEIIHQCDIIGDKVLIFSQSLYSLTVIEYFLSKIDDATQMGDSGLVGGYTGSWSLGLDYFRLDGTSSCDNRAAWCKTFNNPKNTRARLFLISTRAGGLGINLVAANRVIIFDVSWNPSHDIQSIYRVYRFGQVKPSYIYRFVTNGTMEMKVYERQVTKQAISKRVIDEQQIDRHYNQNDLTELYKFEPKPEHRPIPPVPKDVLLGELVHDKAELIYKYHEHHTLLENKREEELNEEERKAAWDEFENEKKMRQMPAHINNIPIHSIMLGLSNYLKREHPDWSSAEIQATIPGMVQEMQEKMLLGDVELYNSMILELRNLQQQQQQQQQQRMQDYYRLQQQNQERMLLERQRQLMQNNATVSYLQRLYANATANNLNPDALSAFNANLANNLGNRQINTNQPQIIETVDIND